MSVCLVEGIGCDIEFSLFDTLVDSTAVLLVGCKDILYNRDDSQFDYWLCLIGNWCVGVGVRGFNCSCNMIL